ncbi:MAG: hypothetical protein KAS78_05265, partial [Candidatus Pacebacteria bacterium]|nr:hypothetical protein [Candidatus Paceibacterota bacterium]
MIKTKSLKKLLSVIMVFAFAVSLVPANIPSSGATETAVSSENQMLHFVMQVRWGNVIGEAENINEANFNGSISVSENARVSLQRALLFEKHNADADKIISKNNPVSWISLIYNHYDGVKVTVSSLADNEVTITTTEGTVTKTAQEL